MKNDEIQPPMNNRHDDGKNLRRMVEDSLLSGRFESALCEIRMMNDPYDRAHYLAELVMTMDQAGKGDEAVTLYDEAVKNILDSACPECLDFKLAALASFQFRRGNHEIGCRAVREGFRMAGRQQSTGEVVRGLEAVANAALPYCDDVFSLIDNVDDRDVDVSDRQLTPVPNLVRYILFRYVNRGDLDEVVRLGGLVRKVIDRMNHPFAKARTLIPLAEAWAAVAGPSEAKRFYAEVLNWIRHEPDEDTRIDILERYIPSQVRAGLFDDAVKTLEAEVKKPWSYLFIHLEIANAFVQIGQKNREMEHAKYIRNLLEFGFSEDEDLRETMESLLEYFPNNVTWPRGYAGMPEEEIEKYPAWMYDYDD